MPRTTAPALAAAAVLAAAAYTITPVMADEMQAKPLLKTALEGMAGTEAQIVRVEVPPGAATQRHLHRGHVFVYVEKGAIELALEGAEPQTVSAGEAIHEPPDTPMVGRNASSEEGATIVIFQVGPEGEPMTVPQPE